MKLVFACAAVLLGLAGCATPPPAAPAAPPAPPQYTASFVCEDGNTPVQAAVCGNAQLAALDVQMAAAFRRQIGSDDIFARDQLLATQRHWATGLAAACGTDTACLANAYQARIGALANAPPPASGDSGIDNYVHYRLLDAKQPALCAEIGDAAAGALAPDGAIDPARLNGGQEIAGTHGPAAGTDPQGGTIQVDLYQSGLYGGYQTRARGAALGQTTLIGPTSLGDYVQSLPNGGGRFTSLASQTGDYGAIDVFALNGAVLAQVTDTIGYNAPAPPGEAATAAVFTIAPTGAAPACLFETYLMPPPLSMGTFAEQPALTPFIALVDAIRGDPPATLAPSDRQDNFYFADDTDWTMFNLPLTILAQAKAGPWIGWLRARHDQVLDSLFAWSQKTPANQAMFQKLFALLQPAAKDLDTIYTQQQGLAANDASQATAIAIMELLYQSTIYLAPDVGTQANAASDQSYHPRYPILANPQ